MKFKSLVAGSLLGAALLTAGCGSMDELNGLLATIPEVTVDENGYVRVKKPQASTPASPAPTESGGNAPEPSEMSAQLAPSPDAEETSSSSPPSRKRR